LLKKIWNLELKNEYNLEYRGRSNAVPVQPEVAKEEGGRPKAASSKQQAASDERQAP